MFKKNFFPVVILLSLISLAAGCCSSCPGKRVECGQEVEKWRMDRNRLNIGAYTLRDNSRTERHVREIAECGIDFMVCVPPDRAMLDLFHKYGVGAIVNEVMPDWWGGDGNNAGKLAQTHPIEKYLAVTEKFQDHPAIWGVAIGDEPSALDFPYYGRVFKCVKDGLPGIFPYLNLYPNYASVAKNNAVQTVNQLGTATYAEHIEKYCENVPSDYLCYDYYIYSAGVARHYENLRIVSNACRRTGRSMWIVLQVNSHDEKKWVTENQLRFQANSALAFGVENIIWACYSRCWWYNQVLDDNGEKTQQYAKLQKVNAEIRAIADEYMKYRNVSTHFIGFPEKSPDLRSLTHTRILDTLCTGVFRELTSEDGCGIIVGQMAPKQKDGSAALFICAADDPMDRANKQFKVTFRCKGFKVAANGVPLTPDADGKYTLTMKSCGGTLITARQ